MPVATPSRVGWLVKLLPPRLRAALDGWSHQVALRHARRRQAAWSRRQAAAAARR